MDRERIFPVECMVITVVFCLVNSALHDPELSWSQLELAAGQKVHIQDILSMSKPMCGRKADCKPNKTNMVDVNLYDRQACFTTYCDCHIDCHINQNCCPDKTYSYLFLQCAKVILLQNGIMIVENIWVVSRCLNDTDPNADRCLNDTLNVLIFSPTTRLFYKNIFCAKCHFENQFHRLDASLSCTEDNKPLPEKIIHGDCKVIYNLSSTDTTISEKIQQSRCLSSLLESSHERLIETCNVSGLWTTYDATVNWACNHFNQRYLEFKNVFCYYCNPSLATKIAKLSREAQISACDKQSAFISPCINRGENARALPFKNGGCQLCYVEALKKTETIEYYDLVVPKEHLSKSFTMRFYHNLTGQTVPLQFYIHINDLFSLFKKENFVAGSVIPSPKNIYYQLKDFGKALVTLCEANVSCSSYYTLDPPKSSLLNKYRLDPICPRCGCDDQCATSDRKPCCADKQLQMKTHACFQPHILHVGNIDAENTTFRVVQSCSNDTVWLDACLGDYSDAINNIPVQSGNGAVYKNIFCYICNNGVDGVVTTYLQVWCEHYVEAEHLMLLSMIADLIQSFGCTAQFFLPSTTATSTTTCDIETDLAAFDHVCFSDGQWRDSSHLTKNCDGPQCLTLLPQFSLKYNKNEFCNVRATVWSVHFAVLTQNTTSEQHVVVCALRTIYWYSDPEFMNWLKYFCDPVDESNVPELNYRTLFSLTVENTEELLEASSKFQTQAECAPGESLDILQLKCRPVTCSGDRVLQNNTCVHTIESVSGIVYTIILAAVSKTPDEKSLTNASNHRTLCDRLTNEIDTALSDIAEIEQGWVVTVLDNEEMTNVSGRRAVMGLDNEYANSVVCDNRAGSFYNVIKINVNVKSTRNRTVVENLLYDIKKYRFESHLNDFGFKQTTLRTQWEGIQPVCSTGYMFKSSVYILKSTFCPLTEVNLENITFTAFVLKVLLEDLDFAIEIPLESIYFVRHKTGYIIRCSVCKDDYDTGISYIEFLEQPKPLFELGPAFTLISLICTITSLFSLFITILTYLLLPVLRTVPGKNNLLLATCLFLAQTFLLCASILPLEPESVQCRLLGLFLHYFWLSTFCAMNTCSYHMFYIFSSFSRSLEPDNKMFFKYFVFVLTSPLAVIVINIGANAASSNGLNYGYGDIRCFVDTSYSVIFGFLLPAMFIVILNFIFYICTFYRIHQSPTLQSNMQNRRNLVIYVKLCTVTGIAWPLLFIDTLFDMSIFSFVATFFNALQGLAMFLAFVCNQRVLGVYKSQLCYTRAETAS